MQRFQKIFTQEQSAQKSKKKEAPKRSLQVLKFFLDKMQNRLEIYQNSSSNGRILTTDYFQAKLKFYTTFTLTVIAVTGFSALMFLVPFVVDPALATLTADFVQKPVSRIKIGLKFENGILLFSGRVQGEKERSHLR